MVKPVGPVYDREEAEILQQKEGWSMGPKVCGACEFVRDTSNCSAIGRLSDLADIMTGEAGTLISNDVEGIVI